MNARKWLITSGTAVLAALAILALAVGLTQAQGPGPESGGQPQAETDVATIAPGAIPIQGRVTDDSGNPLDGVYELTFRLYAVETGGTALCADTNSVSVADGLFSSYMDYCYNVLNGQKVWLGVEVGSDGEMMPRQVIYSVPYALTLRPGAVISASNSTAALQGNNYGTGNGLSGYSENRDGVYGRSDASDHAAVSGENTGGGIGVYGWSDTGTAIRASGTGIIQSTAHSYIWISGNGLRPYHQSDSTVIDMDSIGGAVVTRGADSGSKTVMLPITVPGPLYGQDVTISDLDIYWKGETEFDAISAVIMRRQTGVCSSASCYDDIIFDVGGAGFTCQDGVVPEEGCTVHYDATSNNVLTTDSGILYLTLGLNFNSDTSWINIGGVRLTLEHD